MSVAQTSSKLLKVQKEPTWIIETANDDVMGVKRIPESDFEEISDIPEPFQKSHL